MQPDKSNQPGYELMSRPDLSPEEAARLIWNQWLLIRALADRRSSYWINKSSNNGNTENLVYNRSL